MSETRVDNTSTSSSTESFSQFLEAASKGDLEKLKELQKNIQDINLYDKEGNSALHLAGQNGKIEVLKYLLECEKISIDIKNNLGQTPLLVSYKHLDCGNFLSFFFFSKNIFDKFSSFLFQQIFL